MSENRQMNFGLALAIARTGFYRWAEKPHNLKWVRLIDGTPIPNDLLVNIAEEIVAECSGVQVNTTKERTVLETAPNADQISANDYKSP